MVNGGGFTDGGLGLNMNRANGRRFTLVYAARYDWRYDKGTNLLKMTPFSAAAASAGDDIKMHEGTAEEYYGVIIRITETIIKHEDWVHLGGFDARLFSASLNHHNLTIEKTSGCP